MKLITDKHEYGLLEISHPEYAIYEKALPEEISPFSHPFNESKKMFYYKAIRFNGRFYALKLLK